MSTSAKRPTAPKISSMQIVFGSILAISLLLAINFSGRIAAGRQISVERSSLERDIQTLEAHATALTYQLNQVSGDSFVEKWARGEGKMIKGNEYLVVPVPGLTTPQPVPTLFVPVNTSNTESGQQNWQLWWQLFFDSPPPSGPSN